MKTKYTALDFNQRAKVLEAITGGLALAWFMSCLLSWIIQTTSLTEIAEPFSTSTFILLIFLAFCSLFALTLSKALKEGMYGLYTISSFNAFLMVFIATSYIYGLQQVTNFFFNGGIACLIQIMISYTTAIFTLAETGIINLSRSTCLIFGTTPFLAALFFLIGTHLIGETEVGIKLTTNQLLWITSIIIAVTIAYVSYLLHASSQK
jgi:hypothetical protein